MKLRFRACYCAHASVQSAYFRCQARVLGFECRVGAPHAIFTLPSPVTGLFGDNDHLSWTDGGELLKLRFRACCCAHASVQSAHFRSQARVLAFACRVGAPHAIITPPPLSQASWVISTT